MELVFSLSPAFPQAGGAGYTFGLHTYGEEVGSGMFKTQRIPKHPLFWLKFNTQQSLEKLVCLRVDNSQTVEKEQDVKASDYLNWKPLRYKFQQSTAVLHLQAPERTE